MKSNKKSQVTLFIIIGIIILIGLGLFFVLRQSSQTNEEIQVKVSEVPVEFQPVNDFVSSCIKDIGKEGIKQLGFHGGYTDLKRYGIRANAANPTQSRAFLFNSKDLNSGIAYWNYFKSDNDCEAGCECGSEKPFLKKEQGSPSIETQLQDYVNENLNTCLKDFRSFKARGFDITPLSNVKTEVIVRDSDVLFTLNYKISSKKGDSEFIQENFIAELPVELKKIYELASDLREKEVNSSFLERWTVEQISGFSLGLKEDRLPPIAASELSPGEKPSYWIKAKVKDDIANNMLPVYTPFLTVYNTQNFNNNIIGTFYEKAIIPQQVSNQKYSNLEVKFSYLNWWPIYFDITGRGISGQLIGPETSSSSFFSFIGIKRYNFYYDVSYPVLIDVYSPDAFNNEGLHFYIGLETNVRNNREINCTGPGITQYAVPSGSLFCGYSQGCANVTVETIDAKTNQPLSNVNVFYSSGEESCDKGFTEINNNKAILKASLPACVGEACSLNALKDGYWYYPKTYAVRCDATDKCLSDNVLCSGKSLQLSMEPFRNNSIIIMKKKMLKQAEKTWVFNNAAENLLSNEYAVISLEKVKENANEEDLMLAGIFYGNQTSMQLYPGLIPGIYKARIDLFYQFPDYKSRNLVTFKSVKECDDTFFGLSEQCNTIGPYNFTGAIVEGTFTGEIALTKDMLDNSKNIIFYSLSVPDIDTSYDVLDAYDLDEMSKSENYSATYKVELKPTIS